jgi:hypothetical protein
MDLLKQAGVGEHYYLYFVGAGQAALEGVAAVAPPDELDELSLPTKLGTG